MPDEIERRFLPKSPDWRPEGECTPIAQGYFKLGESAQGRVIKWPWPYFALDGERLLWLEWRDVFDLTPHLSPEGFLPAGWKARIRSYFDARYVLDLKGPRSGTTRFELADLPLDPKQGHALLERCGDTLMRKKRYVIPYLGHAWQIDVFEGKHAGLITCEVELRSATSIVKLPPWVGEEITDRKLFPES